MIFITLRNGEGRRRRSQSFADQLIGKTAPLFSRRYLEMLERSTQENPTTAGETASVGREFIRAATARLSLRLGRASPSQTFLLTSPFSAITFASAIFHDERQGNPPWGESRP